jgi:hypothetical protein
MSASPEPSAEGAADRPPVLVRWAVAFGKFWWDFLVGDTPELFVGTVVSIGTVAWLVHAHGGRGVVVGLLPVLVAAMLWLTTHRCRARH